MNLTAFQSLGTARNAPRFWVEGHRLSTLGFSAGTPISVLVRPQGLTIKAAVLADHHVSGRRAAGEVRPIIDLNSMALLGHISDFREVKVRASQGRIDVDPSVRAFSIARGLAGRSVYRVLDVFAGGGTLSDAYANHPRFEVVAGVEIEPAYADEWARKHPKAELLLGDFRHMSPSELPDFDAIICGIPCTSHSTEGQTHSK